MEVLPSTRKVQLQKEFKELRSDHVAIQQLLRRAGKEKMSPGDYHPYVLGLLKSFTLAAKEHNLWKRSRISSVKRAMRRNVYSPEALSVMIDKLVNSLMEDLWKFIG